MRCDGLSIKSEIEMEERGSSVQGVIDWLQEHEEEIDKIVVVMEFEDKKIDAAYSTGNVTVTLGMLELGKQVAIRSMDEEKNKDDYEEI